MPDGSNKVRAALAGTPFPDQMDREEKGRRMKCLRGVTSAATASAQPMVQASLQELQEDSIGMGSGAVGQECVRAAVRRYVCVQLTDCSY
jgi:hypothetical protein